MMHKNGVFAVLFLLAVTGCSLEDVKEHGDGCPGRPPVMSKDNYLVVENGYQVQTGGDGLYYVEPDYAYCDENGVKIEDKESSSKVLVESSRTYFDWDNYYLLIAENSRSSDKKDAEQKYLDLKKGKFELKSIELEDGKVCERGALVEACARFETEFEFNNCPKDYSQCAYKEDSGYYCKSALKSCNSQADCEGVVSYADEVVCKGNICVVKSCQQGYRLKNNSCDASCAQGEEYYDSDISACVKNGINNCGQKGYSCASAVDHWAEGKCIGGGCMVTACEAGYRVMGKICVADCGTGAHFDYEKNECVEDDVKQCGVSNRNCAEMAGWGDGSCVNGVCVASSCQDGYYLIDASCTEREDGGCGGMTCSELEGWKDGTCEDGVCVANACEEGYCILGGECRKGDSVPEACGLSGNCQVCEEGLVCDNGACVDSLCPQGQHAAGDGCEADSLTVCGELKMNCTEIEHCTDAECENGVCRVIACENHYHIFGRTCEVDDINNCGQHNQRCEYENATAQCLNGTCSIKNCNDNAHGEMGNCILDSNDNCDGFGLKCNVEHATNKCENKTCSYICDETHHDYEGKCDEANDNSNCGTHGTTCTTSKVSSSSKVSCSTGTCVATECSSYYHVYNGACEKNDLVNCVEHGAVCSTEMKPLSTKVDCSYTSKGCIASSCVTHATRNSNGECKCNPYDSKYATSYHEYNNTCELDDNTNCGKHGAACSASDFPFTKTVSCQTGVCKISGCVDHASGYSTTGKCTCSKGYHEYDNTCEKDDTKNCLAHGASCELKPLAKTMACSADKGGCYISSCVSFADPSSDKQACTCKGYDSSAKTSYHEYNNTCELNDNTNCGAHGVLCEKSMFVRSSSVSCAKGTCVPACISSAEIVDGRCVCKASYHEYESSCEANSNTNCGAHGVSCTKADIPNSSVVSCTVINHSGTCRATNCMSGYTLDSATGKCVAKS